MSDSDERLASAILGLLLFSGCSKTPAPKPVDTPPAIVVCSGCGSEFEEYGPGPSKPITQCPNCPMSEEEFERLKDELRKRKAEKQEDDK